jgi:hypothetical protein
MISQVPREIANLEPTEVRFFLDSKKEVLAQTQPIEIGS